MTDILIRAGSFIAIIFLGYFLRRIGVFKKEDFHLLSKIVMRITLPAALVCSFAGRELEYSMLLLSSAGSSGSPSGGSSASSSASSTVGSCGGSPCLS